MCFLKGGGDGGGGGGGVSDRMNVCLATVVLHLGSPLHRATDGHSEGFLSASAPFFIVLLSMFCVSIAAGYSSSHTM